MAFCIHRPDNRQERVLLRGKERILLRGKERVLLRGKEKET